MYKVLIIVIITFLHGTISDAESRLGTTTGDTSSGDQLIKVIIRDQSFETEKELKESFEKYYDETIKGGMDSEDVRILALLLDHIEGWEGASQCNFYCGAIEKLVENTSDDSLESGDIDAIKRKIVGMKDRFREDLDGLLAITVTEKLDSFETSSLEYAEALLDGWYGAICYGALESRRRVEQILNIEYYGDQLRANVLRATFQLQDFDTDVYNLIHVFLEINYDELRERDELLTRASEAIDMFIKVNEKKYGKEKFSSTKRYKYLIIVQSKLSKERKGDSLK